MCLFIWIVSRVWTIDILSVLNSVLQIKFLDIGLCWIWMLSAGMIEPWTFFKLCYVCFFFFSPQIAHCMLFHVLGLNWGVRTEISVLWNVCIKICSSHQLLYSWVVDHNSFNLIGPLLTKRVASSVDRRMLGCMVACLSFAFFCSVQMIEFLLGLIMHPSKSRSQKIRNQSSKCVIFCFTISDVTWWFYMNNLYLWEWAENLTSFYVYAWRTIVLMKWLKMYGKYMWYHVLQSEVTGFPRQTVTFQHCSPSEVYLCLTNRKYARTWPWVGNWLDMCMVLHYHTVCSTCAWARGG